MNREIRRKTPDQLLREIQGEEQVSRGHLKIFLGYASGVGKSFRMLDEARRRRERGQDVVIGAVQPKMSPEIQKLIATLEIVPLKQYSGGAAMNIEAIRKRRPSVCVIDGLAYSNPPGLRNPTRWQDALELVNAGIKVIGSINIQYVEELREQVKAITGKNVTETVPKSFIQSADEIEIVDAPPAEPLDRSHEQQRYPQERQQQLTILREMALVLAADVVEHELNEYLERHGIAQSFGAQERILVCVTPRANTDEMLKTAQKVAHRFHGELYVAYVRQPEISAADKAMLEEKFAQARSAGARVEILDGEDAIETLLDFARSRGVTQLFIGHTQRTRKWAWSDPVDRLIRMSRGMDIRVFPN